MLHSIRVDRFPITEMEAVSVFSIDSSIITSHSLFKLVFNSF